VIFFCNRSPFVLLGRSRAVSPPHVRGRCLWPLVGTPPTPLVHDLSLLVKPPPPPGFFAELTPGCPPHWLPGPPGLFSNFFPCRKKQPFSGLFYRCVPCFPPFGSFSPLFFLATNGNFERVSHPPHSRNRLHFLRGCFFPPTDITYPPGVSEPISVPTAYLSRNPRPFLLRDEPPFLFPGR